MMMMRGRRSICQTELRLFIDEQGKRYPRSEVTFMGVEAMGLDAQGWFVTESLADPVNEWVRVEAKGPLRDCLKPQGD